MFVGVNLYYCFGDWDYGLIQILSCFWQVVWLYIVNSSGSLGTQLDNRPPRDQPDGCGGTVEIIKCRGIDREG